LNAEDPPAQPFSSPGSGRARSRAPLVWILLCLLTAAVPSVAWARASADEPVLAVLPFQVRSAKPLDYLGESVANLIRSRLEAGGAVRVIAVADVLTRVGSGGVPGASSAELRSIADDLGADFVISGSLTELAGRFSLDVRVTPAAAAQPAQTLVVTAQREDELLARVNELADSVLAEVVGVAPSRIVAVEISGANQLEASIRERLRTQVGEEYDPVVLRDDLALLRADPEIATANVETARNPDGVSIRFSVVTTERLLVEPPPGATSRRVDEVVVRGNRRIETAAIRSRIGTTVGGPYRTAQIAKDVRAIYALGFFRNVQVLTEASGRGGQIVIFEVEENPVVRQISISGNDHVDGEKIRDILTLTMGSALDYPLLFENRGRIQALYKAEGYYLAEVDYEIETLSAASVGIHFVVTEGKKLKLRDIQFIGNEAFSDRELRAGFQTKRWRFWSYATSWFDRTGTYSEPLFLQDLTKVGRMYSDAGHVQVEVGEPDVIASEDGLVVSVTIDEGDQFRVGALDVTGDNTVDIDGLRGLLRLREGEIFNRSFLTEDVAALTEHYTNRGFYFANVVPLSNLKDDDNAVDVIFQVTKGPLYFIRNINIAGNTITVDPVIRREIPIVEGELYSQREILMGKARVQSLGFFEEVDFQVQPTDEPDQIDLEVGVVERPTGTFSFGAGFSSQDGFVGTGSLAQDNLFGRGWAARASADIGSQTQRFFLSVSDPYFLGTKFSLGLTVFRTDLNFEDFEQNQTGVDVILGHSLTEDNRTRGFLRYSWASRKVDQDDNVDAAGLIFREVLQDQLTSSLVGLSINSDTRNDRLSPTSGYLASGALDFAGAGFFSKFFRAEGNFAWYMGAPWWLLDKSTFAVGLRAGYALPLNDILDYDFPLDSDGNLWSNPNSFDGNILPLQDIDDKLTLPLSERYFLGGLGEFQLRGFKARSVGPRRAILRQQGGGQFLPLGRSVIWVDETGEEVDREDQGAIVSTKCTDGPGTGGDGNGRCNDISDRKTKDFDDLGETDVIGGNKFISASLEYRFPISETLGLQGLIFFDTGNAFYEGENLFDVTEWRYGTGFGVQWFSPFGPLAVILGFPLDPIEDEKSPVFEFSVGGQGF
jgi:outer membrane protein insertion porin family